MSEIQLGDVAKDSITGFEGVVTGITDWMHGCRRMVLQPKKLHEGKPIEAMSFDEPQIVLVKSARPAVPRRVTGGPRQTPSRNSDPGRR